MNYEEDIVTLFARGKIAEAKKLVPLINWYNISDYHYLSEGFMREFKDKLNWDTISQEQSLSEPFVEEMSDYVNWYYIIRDEVVGENFVNAMMKDLLAKKKE